MALRLLVLPGLTWAYHPDDHSCGWVRSAAVWHRLRHAADQHLLGEAPWVPEALPSAAFQADMANCPVGFHVRYLLDMDARGHAAGLDYGRSRVAGFGLYNLLSFYDVVRSGWPSFGLLHRLCRRRAAALAADALAGDVRSPSGAAAAAGAHAEVEEEEAAQEEERREHSGRWRVDTAAASRFLPAAVGRAAVLVAHARRRLRRNASRGIATSTLAWAALQDLEATLSKAQRAWRASWGAVSTGDYHMVTYWLAADGRAPRCELWSELAELQRNFRSLFELRCVSGHRGGRFGGGEAVCPACLLPSQAMWVEEAWTSDKALADLTHSVPPPAPDWPLRQVGSGNLANASSGAVDGGDTPDATWRGADGRGAARIAVAAILTCEDSDGGLGESKLHVGPAAEASDVDAVLVTHIEALRTLAYSVRRFGGGAATGEDGTGSASLLPVLVLLGLKAGVGLPSHARALLEELGRQGLLRLRELPPAPAGMSSKIWAKIQLWNLLDYALVLYLDADALVVGSLRGLLAAGLKVAGDRFVAAAALTRSMTGVNNGVILLKPSARAHAAWLESYASRPRWTGASRWTGQPWSGAQGEGGASSNASSAPSSGGHPVRQPVRKQEDQDHFNEFLAARFEYRGDLIVDQVGQAGVCSLSMPWLLPYLENLAVGSENAGAAAAEGQAASSGSSNGSKQGEFCTIPPAYNFCATNACLLQLSSARGTGAAKAALRDQLLKAAGDGGGRGGGEGGPDQLLPPGLRRLGARVLHWPGALRKPWQRCAPAARSQLDEAWWKVYHAACREAPAGAECQLRCSYTS